ncbi:hypothetical protein LEN26_017658 [Aphanomyces euteiches]|nr:hypothetical protein LEN26_017658 [Aphanomyces euteiches]
MQATHDRAAIVHDVLCNAALQRERFVRVYECLLASRAKLDIADAVIVHQGELRRWYYTSKHGEVREKPSHELSLLEIKKVFVKKTLQSASNVARKLGVLFHESGKATILTDVQFNTIVCNANAPAWSKTYVVQPFICGKFGPNPATYSAVFGGHHGRIQCYKPPSFLLHTIATGVDGMEWSVCHPPWHESTKETHSSYDETLQRHVHTIVHSVEAYTRFKVSHLNADFILTSEDRLVLVRVANIVFEADQKDLPASMRSTRRRPATAHPTTRPVDPSRRIKSCPGHFCVQSTRRTPPAFDIALTEPSSTRISNKSIIVAETEDAFLAGKGHFGSNAKLATNLCHAVASSRALADLSNVDGVIAARNKLLHELQWFKQQAQTVAEASKQVARFYDTTRVCSLCYLMYQRLDAARTAFTADSTQSTARSTLKSRLPPTKVAFGAIAPPRKQPTKGIHAVRSTTSLHPI